MVATARGDRRLALIGAAAVLALAAASTVAVAAVGGAFTRQHSRVVASCAAPALPGAVVDVTLIDMGAMMGRRQSDWRAWRTAMMRVAVTPQAVSHGTVSLRVTNQGRITHELVVLPLTGNERVGNRQVGQDGTVDESSKLGEVSATCAAGAGDGLAPGATGWSSVTLPAGRYELVCNLPGHYAAGMYAELDIT